jgi:hypothetical protein
VTDTPDQSELAGWVIESRRSHYSLAYWAFFVIGSFIETIPQPPDITYGLRNSSSGKFRKITMPGDHRPAELVEAVRALSKAIGSA